MSSHLIPFNRPPGGPEELAALTDALRHGHQSGDGPFTRQCRELLEGIFSVKRVLLTTSCTHALEMAALLLNLTEGDEVIVPSFTFVSTVNAFALRGVTPRFADIDRRTLNLDVSSVERLLSPATKAVVPVHYAGVGCDMAELLALTSPRSIAIVEDNAHGLFGKYRGQWLGTFGALATQSFHETKNFSCGEGGALLVNDSAMVERAEFIREKGTNRSRFFRGQVDKYTWVDLGSSYVLSDLLAAMLLSQLRRWEVIQLTRRRLWERYYHGLQRWADQHAVSLPYIPSDREQAFHMFYLLLPDLESRQRFIAHLKAQNISSVFHYLPLHLSPMGQRLGGVPGQCPVTENISDRLVRLPFFNDLSPEEHDRVLKAVLGFVP
jgi:dTDP-4-amino-4,6-dideoxygalactose transaminase